MIDRSLHPNSRAVLDAWRRLTHPGLGAEDPANVAAPSDLLSHLFVLQRAEDGAWVFRNSAGDLNLLMGRSLQDRDFMSLWSGGDRERISALLISIALDGDPGVIQGYGETLAGHGVRVELTLAPFARPPQAATVNRMLGLYQLLSPPAALRGAPISRHSVRNVSPVSRVVDRPRLRLIVSND